MEATLIRPHVDGVMCQETYIEEPGDLADHVHRSNLLLAPGILPSEMLLGEKHVVSPPKAPFCISPVGDPVILFFLGPAFEMDIWMAGEKRTVRWLPGSLMVESTNCDMRVVIRGADEFHALFFSCRADHIEQIAFNSGISVPPSGLSPFCAEAPDPQTLRLTQSILAEMKQVHCTPLLLESLLTALMLHTLRRTTGVSAERRRNPSGFAPRVLHRIMDYMQDRLHAPLSLEGLALIAGVSVSHFCSMFKQSTGMPPYQYLVQQRIAKAKRLLQQTSLSIGEIGFDTGFGSSSQFSHAFKKAAQCTPQEYRRLGGARTAFALPANTITRSQDFAN